MNEAPKIDTSAWRLPKKTGRTLDDPVPHDAYAKVGLPIDPQKPQGPQDPSDGPAARGGDLPGVDTTSWRLPKSTNEKGGERRVLAEKPERVPGLIEDPRELVRKTSVEGRSAGDAKMSGGPKSSKGDTHKTRRWDDEPPKDKRGKELLYGGEDEEVEEARTMEGEPLQQGKVKRGMKIPGGMGTSPWVVVKASPKTVTIAKTGGHDTGPKLKGKLTYRWDGKGYKRQGEYLFKDGIGKLKESVDATEARRVPMEAERRGRKVKESVSEYVDANLREQRILAGLDTEDHLRFATGTPYRRMKADLQEAIDLGEEAWSDVKKMKARLAKAAGVKSHQVSANMSFDKLKWLQVPADKSVVAKIKKAFKGHEVHWDRAREQAFVYPKGAKKESAERRPNRLSAEQRQLSGLTEAAPVPHGVGDGSAPRRGTGAGILDDQTEAGEDYINRVLQESEWFFKDFSSLSLGAFDPMGEAPAGRRGPWRGSDDTAAPTPVVRKGKVKGMIGGDDDEEDNGDDAELADIDDPELDLDDEDHPKLADDEDDEPEGGEDEEPEDIDTEGVIRKVGGALHRAGGRMSHARSSERAKEKLKKGLRHFAKKHGIKYPRDED